VLTLVRFEHPSIGLIELFGQQIWLGWLMIAALVYSGLPPVLLGRAKMRLAAALHDKVLFAWTSSTTATAMCAPPSTT